MSQDPDSPGQRRIGEIPPEMGEYICPFCGRIFRTHAELHRHIRREQSTPPERR